MTGDPCDLVGDYRPGDFLLAGPSDTLLATGAQAVVRESDPDELAAKVTKLLVESGADAAVGALPFDPAAEPRIVIPVDVRRAGPAHGLLTGPRPVLRPTLVTPDPSPAAYVAAVTKAVTALRAGDLRKVVLARALRLDFADDIDIARLLPGLAAANPLGYAFAADLSGGRTLMGSSPELLLARRGGKVLANPLAGSLPRGADAVTDKAAAATLMASAKNQSEHRVVVDAMVEILRPFCRRLTVQPAASLVATPTVWHLSTDISGELIDQDVSSLRLAAALHPTPAVCGTPTAAARAAIVEWEPFDRGFYTGAVGWCDAAGDGEWIVAIRCAEVAGRSMRLFAGAGIMPDSQPDVELVETEAKLHTLLSALGGLAD
jgi:isochorismate synthase